MIGKETSLFLVQSKIWGWVLNLEDLSFVSFGFFSKFHEQQTWICVCMGLGVLKWGWGCKRKGWFKKFRWSTCLAFVYTHSHNSFIFPGQCRSLFREGSSQSLFHRKISYFCFSTTICLFFSHKFVAAVFLWLCFGLFWSALQIYPPCIYFCVLSCVFQD